MATKTMPTLGSKYFIIDKPIKKSITVLEELRKAAEEALDKEKAEEYAQSMTQAAKSVQRSVGSMKRALAGFDELNRMNRLKTATVQKSEEQLLLEYLNSVDVKQTIARLQLIRSQIDQCAAAMVNVVAEIYTVDLALKMQESALIRHGNLWQSMAVYINTVATAQQRLTQMTTQWCSQASQMTTLAGTLKNALTSLQVQLQSVGAQQASTQLQTAALDLKWTALLESTGKLSSMLSVLRTRLITLFDSQVQGSLSGSENMLRQQLFQLQTYLQSGFFPQWKQAWSNIAGVVTDQMGAVPYGLKNILNSTITLFNSFLNKLTAGMNSWIHSHNQLQARISAQTGTPILRLPVMSTPKIPLLAQGAVLPANKPFMAVVGDQRHGTNVEAPLATIQEAVAAVMQDFVSANMAGHEATVGVLRQILEAVLGIHIGDDVIGAAMQRYRSKMAVVTGGGV